MINTGILNLKNLKEEREQQHIKMKILKQELEEESKLQQTNFGVLENLLKQILTI